MWRITQGYNIKTVLVLSKSINREGYISCKTNEKIAYINIKIQQTCCLFLGEIIISLWNSDNYYQSYKLSYARTNVWKNSNSNDYYILLSTSMFYKRFPQYLLF